MSKTKGNSNSNTSDTFDAYALVSTSRLGKNKGNKHGLAVQNLVENCVWNGMDRLGFWW